MRGESPPLYNQCYLDTGGEGQPVVLLHGLFGNITMWDPTVDALKASFRVIVPRLPIFEPPVQQDQIDHLVDAIEEFIQWHRLTNVTLVGHAFGGQLALLYAAEHPANVSQIVLTASSGMVETFSAEDDDFLEQPSMRFSSDRPGKGRRRSHDQTASKAAGIFHGHRDAGLQRETITSILNKLDHMTLLLWGLEDKVTPPEVALHFHDFLPNSEIRFIENGGHFPMVDQPQPFIRLLVEFLKKANR